MMSKYFMMLAVTMLPTTMFSLTETSSKLETDRAYILGFEDGSEAVTNAVNAEMCATHYKQSGQPPGPECYKFYENFKLRIVRYEKIKKSSSRLMKLAKENLALYEEAKRSNAELLEDSSQQETTVSFLLEFVRALPEQSQKDFIFEISDIMEEISPGIRNKINEDFGANEIKLDSIAKEIRRTRNKLASLTSEQKEKILKMVEE